MKKPDFFFERASRQVGYQHIAGLDEAGRGPLAGPVVAGAVILPHEWMDHPLPTPWSLLNDSKKLTARTRETLFQHLTSNPDIQWSVAAVGTRTIDQVNILNATRIAMIRALEKLRLRPQQVLVDGLPVRDFPFEQRAIIKGDSQSLSIAAASIIAKVIRDRIMQGYEKIHSGYGFGTHKGYGTPAHLIALEKWGPCPIHRQSFAPVRRTQLTLPF